MTKRESIFWTVLLAVGLTCVIMVVNGTFAPPPAPHPTPTLHFDAFTDLNENTGFYGNEDGEIMFSCNGEIVKREDELTREDLLAMIDFLIKGDSGDFGYFEALCPAPPPFSFSYQGVIHTYRNQEELEAAIRDKNSESPVFVYGVRSR